MPKSRQVVVPCPSSKAGLGVEPWGTAWGGRGHELLRGEKNPTRTSPSPPASTEPVPNFRGSLAAGMSRKCPATSSPGSGGASDSQRQPQHRGGCLPRPLTPSRSPPYLRRAPLGSRRRRRLPPGPEEEEEEGGDPQHPQHGQRQPAGRPPHSGERGRLKKSRRGRKRRGR